MPGCVGLLGAFLSSHVSAHTISTPSGPVLDPTSVLQVAVPVLVAAALYICGLLRLRDRQLHLPTRSAWRMVAFFSGLATLVLALLSPLDVWSAESFAFHMVQHEVLMLIAAPLLVLGRPLPVFLWAFPAPARARIGRWARSGAVRSAWNALLNPIAAWALHAVALWLWHAPSLFDAALRNARVHDLQHITFLASALIFWAALMEERARERQGAAVLYLFTTTVHTGVLGALLTFATHPWYSAYLEVPSRWGLSPLEDQQLGGLIMWVPASLVYVGVGLLLLARWIESSSGSGDGAGAIEMQVGRVEPRGRAQRGDVMNDEMPALKSDKP